jgi:hypothetical protein
VTQTAGAPAPTPGSAPATRPSATSVTSPAPAPPVPATATKRDLAEDVPSLLNRLQVLAVAAIVIFGALAAVLQVLSWQANGRAADNTEQVVRVQQIQSLLLRADALATNSYLVGGLEPAEARAEYDESIDTVLRLVADAAEAQPADRAVLADLNAAISSYTTSVAQARDYNRQQLVIGIAYLNRAGDSLRDAAIPITQALADANSERASDEMDGQSPIWLLLSGAAAIGVLLLLNRQLASRFHRRYNVGLVVAAVLIGATTVVTAWHAQAEHNGNESLQSGAYDDAIGAAAARTAANNARAIEAQGLINRGSGADSEDAWGAQADIVADNLDGLTLDEWSTYTQAHADIRAADDAGDWDGAVQQATATGAGTAAEALDAVDSATAADAETYGEEAAAGFRAGGAFSLVLVVLTGLAALLAAYAATRGIGTRRKEYA